MQMTKAFGAYFTITGADLFLTLRLMLKKIITAHAGLRGNAGR